MIDHGKTVFNVYITEGNNVAKLGWHFCFSDLVSAYGIQILPAVESQAVQQILFKTRKAKSSKTKAIANWAFKEIRKLKAPTA